MKPAWEWQPHILFLGHFAWDDYRDFVFSIGVGAQWQGNCRAWARIFDSYRERVAREHLPVDANGWAEFVQPKSPPSWTYVQTRDLPGLPTYFNNFSCGSGSFHYCTASVCVGSDASFIYKFSLGTYERKSWPVAVERAAAGSITR